MAKTTKTKTQLPFDATRPLYAAVGVGDLAVAIARSTAGDVSTRFAKVDLQPKALRQQGVTVVSTRVDELNKGAKALPAKLEALVNDYVAEINGTVGDLNKQYVELASRGKDLVARIRKQQATSDLKAEATSTVNKAKTTTTQAKKAASTSASSAKKSASRTTSSAKKASAPAKSSAKATGTAAKKTASTASKATSDAAAKTGS